MKKLAQVDGGSNHGLVNKLYVRCDGKPEESKKEDEKTEKEKS